MSIEISKQSNLSIPRSLKWVGIIGGAWAILTTVGAVIAYFPGHPDFSPFSTVPQRYGGCSRLAANYLEFGHAHCGSNTLSCTGVAGHATQATGRRQIVCHCDPHCWILIHRWNWIDDRYTFQRVS